MNIFVEEVCRESLEFIGLEVEVLKFAQIVERSLSYFLYLVIIKRQPQ